MWEWVVCQTRKPWSFMHMVHSDNKPQHWTNRTDPRQNQEQAQQGTMGNARRSEEEACLTGGKRLHKPDELKGSPRTKWRNDSDAEQRKGVRGGRRRRERGRVNEWGHAHLVVGIRAEPMLQRSSNTGRVQLPQTGPVQTKPEPVQTRTSSDQTGAVPVLLGSVNPEHLRTHPDVWIWTRFSSWRPLPGRRWDQNRWCVSSCGMSAADAATAGGRQQGGAAEEAGHVLDRMEGGGQLARSGRRPDDIITARCQTGIGARSLNPDLIKLSFQNQFLSFRLT